MAQTQPTPCRRAKVQVYFRVPSDVALVRRAAKLEDRSPSAWGARILVSEAKKVIATHGRKTSNKNSSAA